MDSLDTVAFQSRKDIFKIIFLPVLFAFYLHIVSASADLIYYSNVAIPLCILLVFGFCIGTNKKIDKNILVFLPFLGGIFISVFLFNFTKAGLVDFVKYILYVVVYIFVIKKHYCSKYVFKAFILFLTTSFVFMLLLYVLALNSDFYLNFVVDDLGLASNSAYVTRKDWVYSLPLYILSFPINVPENGILGVPRFYGFSAEPSMYSMAILPCIFISYKFRMYFSSLILLFALLISSSYGAFSILILSLVSGVFIRVKSLRILIIVLSLMLLGYLFFGASSLVSDSDRLSNYINIFKGIMDLNFTFFGSGNNTEKSQSGVKLSFALVSHLYKYGFLALIGYLYFVFRVFQRVLILQDWVLVSFCLAFVLMLNKSGEPLSPLFLFYLSFIDYWTRYRAGRFDL